MNKTISPRTKLFRDNANRKGWHVHCDGEYIGYDDMITMTEIVADYASGCTVVDDGGFRLTCIMGNVLVFEA